MPKIAGINDLTEKERNIIIAKVENYILFGLKEREILELLEKHIGRQISPRTLYKIKHNIREKQGTADQWLDKYARLQVADFYRQRITELEYLQSNLFLILDEEKAKGDKRNIYRYNTIAKTIIENSKVLSDLGMAPPIIAKIKELLPVDINELNTRQKESQNALVSSLNGDMDIKDDDIIDVDTLNENEQSELDRLQELRKSAKTAFRLEPDDQSTGESSGENRKSSSDSQDNRVF
jgi:hypothetical protein